MQGRRVDCELGIIERTIMPLLHRNSSLIFWVLSQNNGAAAEKVIK